MSSTAANLIFSLQRRHGLGVRPAAYSSMKSSTTSVVEALGHVPDVERDADHVSGAARVVAVLDGAAAPRARAVRRRVARQREVDAGHVVAGLDGAGRGDGRVHAAGHGGQDPHQSRTPRARSTQAPMASTTAVTSASVEVWPEGEAQRAAGRGVLAAHRQQHVGGLGHACRAGRAGRALDAAGVEEHQQRVTLAAGEGEVDVAGQPLGVPGVGTRAVEHRVGHDLEHAGDQALAQGGHPRRVLGLAAHREARARRRSRRSRGCRGCRCGCRAPGRRRARAGPPRPRGVRRARRRRAVRRSCDRSRSSRRRRRRRSRRAARRGPARRRCAPGCRARRATSTTSATGWRVPTSLFAHITETRATLPGHARCSRAAPRRRGGPAASTGRCSTSAPACSASQSRGSSTAWCSTAVVRMRTRRGSSARRDQ